MPSPPPPHDALFKACFGQPDLARSELALLLPPAVQEHVDLATLEVCPGSFVDEELRHGHTDLLYTVRLRDGGRAFLYILYEHQSTFDRRMPLRLLKYMLRVWEQCERDHPRRKLPVVLPVVLHHGRGRWGAAPDFASVLEASPSWLAAVGRYQPLFRFVLDDLGPVSPEQLAARELHALARLVELALWAARSVSRLRQAAPHMQAILATLPRDARARLLLTQLYVYLLRDAAPEVEDREVRAILDQIAGPHGQEDIMNAGERLIEQGRAEGLERGRTEGLVDGLRAAIATALVARSVALSEAGRARIASCSDIDTLTRWLGRAVTAASEAEVFASAGTP